MYEINKNRKRLGKYRRLCVELQSWPVSYKNTYSRTFPINFSVNSSGIPYCTPGKSVSKKQMPAARLDLYWSAASARLLYDTDLT
jgi:hypothetical protein